MLDRKSQTLAAIRMRELRKERGGRLNGNPEFRHPDIVLGFRAKQHCILCGDGFSELHRKCRLHPGICDACEREYCECSVEDSVKLTEIEDIARYPEEQRVDILRARKLTLKSAGKRTTAMTCVQPQPDEHIGFVPFRSRKFYPDPDNEGGHAFDNVERAFEEQE